MLHARLYKAESLIWSWECFYKLSWQWELLQLFPFYANALFIQDAFSVPEAVPQPVLLLHDAGGQILAYSKKHEESPLPSEGVDQRDKAKPIEQFRVCEEVKCPCWSQRLDGAREVYPPLHPPRMRSSQRIDQKHE